MKRWLLSICMVLCIGVLTFSLRINANQDINVDYPYKGIPTEKELKGKSEAEIEFIFQEISQKQQAAVEASGKIHNTLFSMNKDGIWEYPDEYGGMFIDEFILHVLLTDVSDAMIEKYHKVLGESVGVVRFEKAEKSYNELKSQAEDFMTALNKESIPFSEIFVQEEYNRVAVFVEKKEEISAKKLAKRKGFDPSVSVFVAKGEAPTTTANLRGGDGLTLTNGSSFSLGFCGTYNGYKAVISCGHAFSSVGQNVYRVGSSTAIGVSVFRRYPESGFYTSGDLSIIRVTSSDTHTNTVWNPKSPGSGYTSVSGAQYYFTNGQVLHRYGYASGTGYGIVSAVNTCVAYGALDDTSGHYVTNLVRVTNSYNVAIGGDSGGSWVLKGSQNYLCGIQSGKWRTTVNNQVVDYMYFSPYSLYSAVGFVMKTNYN